MKTKFGNTVYLARLSRWVLAISTIGAVPSAMLVTFANVQRHIGLCPEAQENQFQDLL
jgi:hypothetical protein